MDLGVDGLLAAGSTGEAPLLDEDEYRNLIGWLRDIVPEDRILMAGAGRESTRATVRACHVAAAEGADAALVRPPAYYANGLDVAAFVRHFRQVADESPIPVLVYNIPKFTNVMLHESVLSGLAEHPNVVGAKDSSADLKVFAAYREAVPKWAMFVGSGSHFYAALELGAVGGILAVAAFAAPLAVEIRDTFAAGDRAAAGAAQERLTPLNKAVVGGMGVPGVKAAMDALGLEGGPVRAPLVDLNEDDRARVAELVRGAGLVPVGE